MPVARLLMKFMGAASGARTEELEHKPPQRRLPPPEDLGLTDLPPEETDEQLAD